MTDIPKINPYHETVAYFHNLGEGKGEVQYKPTNNGGVQVINYDKISKNTLNPIENFDPKSGIDRTTDYLPVEVKRNIENKALTQDTIEISTKAADNKETAKAAEGFVKGTLNGIKKHPIVTAVIVAVPVIAATVYGVKKVNESKAQKA